MYPLEMKSCISGQHDILVLGNVPPPGNEKVGFQVNMTFDSGQCTPPGNEKVGFQVSVTFWFWAMSGNEKVGFQVNVTFWFWKWPILPNSQLFQSFLTEAQNESEWPISSDSELFPQKWLRMTQNSQFCPIRTFSNLFPLKWLRMT